MERIIKKGSTSVLLLVMLRDESTGAGKTGLAYGSMTIYYCRDSAAAGVAVTPADMTLGTWASGGWKEVDATNLPGIYQFGIPDAALATGANGVVFVFQATETLDKTLSIALVGADLQDTVRLGLTALPNSTPAGNGGLPTVDANNRIAGIQGTKTTLDALNDLSAATVNAQCDTALSDYDAPTRAELTLDKNEILARFSTTDGLITTADTVVDAISAILSHGTHGLAALKALIDTLQASNDSQDTEIAGAHTKLDTLLASEGSVLGSGADSVTITITSDSVAVPDADVWITSDADGNTVVAGTAQTNSSGQITFLLDHGSQYYLWMQKDGVNPIRGTSFIAERDV